MCGGDQAGMERTISSGLTIFYKLVLAPVWIGGFGLATLGLWMVGAFFLTWFCVPLKCVKIDGSDLVVSNFLWGMRVPFDQVRDVTENVLINIHPVWIHFREPTRLGRKIVFMPTVRMFALFGSHPVVEELTTLVRQARSETQAERGSRPHPIVFWELAPEVGNGRRDEEPNYGRVQEDGHQRTTASGTETWPAFHQKDREAKPVDLHGRSSGIDSVSPLVHGRPATTDR